MAAIGGAATAVTWTDRARLDGMRPGFRALGQDWMLVTTGADGSF